MKKVNKFDAWCDKHPIFEAFASFIVICIGIAIFAVMAFIMMG